MQNEAVSGLPPSSSIYVADFISIESMTSITVAQFAMAAYIGVTSICGYGDCFISSFVQCLGLRSG